MAIFRLLTLGFGAGAFGACILALVSAILNALRIQEQDRTRAILETTFLLIVVTIRRDGPNGP